MRLDSVQEFGSGAATEILEFFVSSRATQSWRLAMMSRQRQVFQTIGDSKIL